MAGHLLTCNLGLQEHWQTNGLNKGNMPASTKIINFATSTILFQTGLKVSDLLYKIGELLIVNESSSVKKLT